MPGDYSRNTFIRAKQYRGVLKQQGRVDVDADWNEQVAIQLHRTETEAVDVIGHCGVPKGAEGFKIETTPNGLDLKISNGRIYVDGILCECLSETPTTYSHQPYYPNPDYLALLSPLGSPPDGIAVLSLADGLYLVFLDVWQREVTALEDPFIREKALGGPDTATRLQTIWQVKLLHVTPVGTSPPLSPPETGPTCDTVFPEFEDYTAPSTGKLNAQTATPADEDDPCQLPPTAGYRRLENQLYRVEVHTGGNRNSATFKWSRDNGSVTTSIEKIDSNRLTVSDLGKDDLLGFAADQWVEIIDDESELKGTPRPLVQIQEIAPSTRQIILKSPVALSGNGSGRRLRRWDQSDGAGVNGVPMSANWIDLEDGVQVQFSDGAYHSGDYWLIPARTATGDIEWPPFEIPNTHPIPQSPSGIRHHYCRLALLEAIGGTLNVLEDCRKQFPSLTEICAEDICFESNVCQFPGAKTVQDAIEALCREDLDNDLKCHNKYLHGSGVVCGLKLRCHSDRRQVLLEPGYALDCEGNSIHVRTAQAFRIVDAAMGAGLLDDSGDGDVCVRIDRGFGHDATLSLEAVVPQTFWDSVLEGTLLKDFFKDCIESLFDFLRANFLPIPDNTVPVSAKQKRVISFLNLLIQRLNSASGPYVFLSTEEHQILFDFYNALKDFIASETFCAMFDGDRPFPNYPYGSAPGIETAFGLFKFHQRLRIHPSGNYGYTCGGGPNIQVYNLQARTMQELLAFPGGSNVEVHDVAFSENGSEMYAVALNGPDSVFSTVTIGANQSHTWGPTHVVCDFKFLTLATHQGQLLALAKAKGLYSFNPANIPLSPPPIAPVPFNATGLLKVSEDGNFAFAARNKLPAETSTFDSMIQINLTSLAATGVIYEPPVVTGSDAENDIVDHLGIVHITGNPSAGQVKSLYSFNAATGAPVGSPVDLQENTPTRLAVLPGTDDLLVALSDRYKLIRINLASRAVVPNFRVPVQIMPLGLSARNNNEIIVLNYLSNTLSVVNIATVISAPPVFTMEPPSTLSTYRQQILDAYEDLLGHLVQHLKDCFCDHFLVECPDCTKDAKVYLGCVEIKGNKVFNICNLSKRHYVKTFKTYGYWLSTIPILPLIKEAIARFCCRVL